MFWTAGRLARSRTARVGLVAWMATGVSVAMGPAALAESGTQKMQTSAEAWYTLTGAPDPVADVCVLVGQCPQDAAPPDPNPYPPDTLHVDIAAGHERARTYLAFDLSQLPMGAVVNGGTVRLPIADAAAGTAGAEPPKLQLCVVRTPFDEVEGSIDEAPAPDCGTPAPITIEDQDGKLTAVADVAPLAPDWEAASTAAVAVLPTPEAIERRETWQVAFSGRERQAEGAAPITASFDYTVTEDGYDGGGGGDFLDDGAVDFGVPSQLPDPGIDLGTGAPSPVADLAAPGVAQEAVSDGEVVVRRFAYPLIFLLPILLLSGAWYFSNAFTATPLPVGRRPVRGERG